MGGIDGRGYTPLNNYYGTKANTFENQTIDTNPTPQKAMAMVAGALLRGGAAAYGEGPNLLGVASEMKTGAEQAGAIYDYFNPPHRITPEEHYGLNTAAARQNQMRFNRGSIPGRTYRK